MKLRYVELKPDRIFNALAPENKNAWGALEQYREQWWEQNTIEVRNYFADRWREVFDRITNHFTNLRKSMKENGILRPISVVSGPMRNVRKMSQTAPVTNLIPPQYQNDIDQLLYTQPFGGSRITVAQEVGIEKIPCVVHDYSNLFPQAEEVTKQNYSKWFGKEYNFTNAAPQIRIRSQLHLTGVYEKFGSESKKARGTANKIALEKTREKYG